MGKLEETLDQGVKDGKVPHVIVAATNASGSFTYNYRTGTAQYPGGNAIEDDAVLQLASQSKLLTTIAALRVVEKGLIGLDDDAGKHLPVLAKQPIFKGFDENEKPILDERKNPITLRKLLTHSAGTVYDAMNPDLVKLRQNEGHVANTGVTIDARFGHAGIYEPGTSWMYSTGIDWAGRLIENLTNQTLEEFMQENMWKPMGLKNITFWPDKHLGMADRIPQLTIRGPDGKLAPHNAPTLNTGSVDCFGGHGIYATMSDYLAVQRSILANDGKLLKPETVDMMFQPQLNDAEQKALMAFMASPYGASIIGEWKPKLELNWGLGGILLMQDDEGRRKKGTLSWGGMVNPFWLIDREADLALTFGTQVLPPGDSMVSEMISAIEYNLYKQKGVKF
ncbi:hypothetical protein LTR86_004607 [Recurvomyces mirabilis]|nr:hypothetical protein LTR86_004607 [Recurvomyces mirabilis]